jgi:hypothetical protein
MSLPARIYTVTFENVSVAASQDLFEITPADDKPIQIWGWEIDNVGGTADAGDAQEEFWRLLLRTGHATSGSGGTAPTPAAVVSTDGAAGFTAEANNTTIASTGTTRDIWAGGLNVRIPGPFFLPPELCPVLSQADTRVVLRLLSTPADAVSCSGTIWVAELG